MRIDAFKYLGIAAQIAAIASQDQGGKSGDTLLYWAVRRLAKQLQDRNPGIAYKAGFFSELED